MSLLDDARRLASIDWSTEMDCSGCSRNLWEDRETNGGHANDCPMLSMPKIVKALEALEEAQRQLMFLGHPHFRTDHAAVLSLADRVLMILAVGSA